MLGMLEKTHCLKWMTLNSPTQNLKIMLMEDGSTFCYMSMDFCPSGLIHLYMWQATKITEKPISKCLEKILTNQECHIQSITEIAIKI